LARYELKTKATGASVRDWLAGIGDAGRRKDCESVLRIMKKATRSMPRMWGPAIVGFGSYRYRTRGGQEYDWFLTGFASRKTDLTLYIMDGADRYPELLGKLGRFRLGKSCLYLKRLSDVNLAALERLVSQSVRNMRSRVACS
jgi:hypothetical protein